VYTIYKKSENYNHIVIYGATKLGTLLYEELEQYCLDMGKTICFADNSSKKWSNKVLKPDIALTTYPGALWIIAAVKSSDLLYRSLLESGVKESSIVKKLPFELLFALESEDKLKRLTSQGKLFQIDVDVADHCNLNCAGCNKFSPLVSSPKFADFAQFDRDLERLSYLLHGLLGRLNLLGGEPLLNSQLPEFLVGARKHFPYSVVQIVTNGLLLPKAPNIFWQTCVENDIRLLVTPYPINFDYDGIEKLARKNNVGYEYIVNEDRTTFNFAFDTTGSQDPYESFSNCFMANFCVTLKSGKISTCPPILNIEYFNNHFGTNLDLCPYDYIDIYDAKSGCDILDFISKPVPFCRFCNVKARTDDNPWHLSKREITEWTVDAT